MLIVDLIINFFHLKLDNFYCIGVMNSLKVICFLVHIKMSYYWLNGQELLKGKHKYHYSGSKGKAVEYYLKNREKFKRKSKE